MHRVPYGAKTVHVLFLFLWFIVPLCLHEVTPPPRRSANASGMPRLVFACHQSIGEIEQKSVLHNIRTANVLYWCNPVEGGVKLMKSYRGWSGTHEIP
jgi:hypothetical protein